jgi:hypothetical protein
MLLMLLLLMRPVSLPAGFRAAAATPLVLPQPVTTAVTTAALTAAAVSFLSRTHAVPTNSRAAQMGHSTSLQQQQQ